MRHPTWFRLFAICDWRVRRSPRISHVGAGTTIVHRARPTHCPVDSVNTRRLAGTSAPKCYCKRIRDRIARGIRGRNSGRPTRRVVTGDFDFPPLLVDFCVSSTKHTTPISYERPPYGAASLRVFGELLLPPATAAGVFCLINSQG